MKENKYLKWLLIIQSFLPLFLLILIRCFCLNNFKLVSQFFIRLFQKDFGVKHYRQLAFTRRLRCDCSLPKLSL